MCWPSSHQVNREQSWPVKCSIHVTGAVPTAPEAPAASTAPTSSHHVRRRVPCLLSPSRRLSSEPDINGCAFIDGRYGIQPVRG